MKDKIIKILINAAIGVLTSVVSLYLGAGAVETVVASGAVAGTVGARVEEIAAAAFT